MTAKTIPLIRSKTSSGMPLVLIRDGFMDLMETCNRCRHKSAVLTSCRLADLP
jgi:hypothetical protein